MTGDITGQIHLWNTSKKQEERTLIGPSGGVKALRVLSPQNFVVSHGGDNTLLIWDATTGEQIWQVNSVAVAFSDDGALVLSWDGGALRVTEVATQKILLTVNNASSVFSVSHDARTLLIGVRKSDEIDGLYALQVWDIPSRSLLSTISTGGTDLASVIHISGSHALVGDEGHVDLVNWSSGQDHPSFRRCALFSVRWPVRHC